jgi:outer membrane protein assembly factor BamB
MYRASSAEDRSVLVTAFSGKLFGIDRATGQPRWFHQLEAVGAVELLVDGGMVIAASLTKLTFLRYDNGQVVKQIALLGEYASRPIMMVDGGQIFVARNGELAAYTLAGDPIWVQPFTGQGFGRIALALPGAARQADDAGAK